MDRFLNFELLKHPINWVVLTLMYLIAGIAFHVAAGAIGLNSTKDN